MGDRSLNDALDLVWRRAELPTHVLSAAELASWPTDQRARIVDLGLLRRTTDATALICEDCGSPHPVEVIRDPRKPQRPYYLCPEIGRVPLTPSDLQRWEADFDQIAFQIRRAVGLTAKAVTVVPSRIWLLGRQQTGDRYWELFMMRGLCWPDGVQMLSQCSRVQQSPAPVVVVPHRIPSSGITAPSWPIRTLAEVVSLAGSDLVVDIATLTIAVAAFGSSSATSTTKVARQRMSRSFGTPEAVKVMTEYLRHTGLTDTQFGNQFQSTDRTVRRFRLNGTLRRSTFEAMAESMDLTSEELLRGELPPSMKQPSRR
jgi:hypothetical protein